MKKLSPATRIADCKSKRTTPKCSGAFTFTIHGCFEGECSVFIAPEMAENHSPRAAVSSYPEQRVLSCFSCKNSRILANAVRNLSQSIVKAIRMKSL